MIKISNIAPVFVVPDEKKTAEFYRDQLGFRIGRAGFGPEPFVPVYRDPVEIILVRSPKGLAVTNRSVHGTGYDAFLAVEDVDGMAEELKSKNVKIARGPLDTKYGTREVLIEDCNGFHIVFGYLK